MSSYFAPMRACMLMVAAVTAAVSPAFAFDPEPKPAGAVAASDLQDALSPAARAAARAARRRAMEATQTPPCPSKTDPSATEQSGRDVKKPMELREPGAESVDCPADAEPAGGRKAEADPAAAAKYARLAAARSPKAVRAGAKAEAARADHAEAAASAAAPEAPNRGEGSTPAGVAPAGDPAKTARGAAARGGQRAAAQRAPSKSGGGFAAARSAGGGSTVDQADVDHAIAAQKAFAAQSQEGAVDGSDPELLADFAAHSPAARANRQAASNASAREGMTEMCSGAASPGERFDNCASLDMSVTKDAAFGLTVAAYMVASTPRVKDRGSLVLAAAGLARPDAPKANPRAGAATKAVQASERTQASPTPAPDSKKAVAPGDAKKGDAGRADAIVSKDAAPEPAPRYAFPWERNRKSQDTSSPTLIIALVITLVFHKQILGVLRWISEVFSTSDPSRRRGGGPARERAGENPIDKFLDWMGRATREPPPKPTAVERATTAAARSKKRGRMLARL